MDDPQHPDLCRIEINKTVEIITIQVEEFIIWETHSEKLLYPTQEKFCSCYKGQYSHRLGDTIEWPLSFHPNPDCKRRCEPFPETEEPDAKRLRYFETESLVLNKIIDWACEETGLTRKKGVVHCDGTNIQQGKEEVVSRRGLITVVRRFHINTWVSVRLWEKLDEWGNWKLNKVVEIIQVQIECLVGWE